MSKSPAANEAQASKDSALIESYGECPETVDQIVANPEIVDRFCIALNDRLPQSLQFDPVELSHRLLNLRKRGCLPRKHRAFNGRNKPR